METNAVPQTSHDGIAYIVEGLTRGAVRWDQCHWVWILAVGGAIIRSDHLLPQPGLGYAAIAAAVAGAFEWAQRYTRLDTLTIKVTNLTPYTVRVSDGTKLEESAALGAA